MNRPAHQSAVLLLDLSGDERAARAWAAQLFGDFQTVNKADLKWVSKRAALGEVRKLAPGTFAFFTGDLGLQGARGSMILFAALAGARHIVFGDACGRLIKRTRLSAFAVEAPRLACEFLLGYLFVIPLSWVLTFLLSAALGFRKTLRAIQRQEKHSQAIDGASRSMTALYIRATLSSAKEGGMLTHVAGFTDGAYRLGHHLQFLVSGDPQTKSPDRIPRHVIASSAVFSTTRAIFELWNNLIFTQASLGYLVHEDSGQDVDFIYQRYSRFNWTGVALSVLTGLPLALEFNGSEVWVSQRWDPVGQLPLLRRFERLNLRAADFVFTVSEVERRRLVESGVAANKITTNPNGVDVEKFRPDCGGAEVRRALGIEDKIVVGFLGTFGPWHGAPLLAKAALEVNAPSHFLFIGDGEERARAEEILASFHGRATFIGRIPHDKVAAHLDACDILASPHVAAPDGSEFFGSPTKLFEYLAMGKPVVASLLGQIADVIVDGDSGLLVEPGDASALAKAIDILAADAALRAGLGSRARQTVVERFTWEHNAARVFEEVKNFGG